jgi:type IV secretory pathway VirJ component
MKETLAALVAALGLTVTPAPAMERALEYGAPFGQVMLYTPVAEPRSVVLFISGDDGWNLGVLDMARHLAGQGAVVAGIDARRYLAAIAGTRGSCRYLAGDLEALGHRVQRELRLETYRVPLVYGFSSGANLAYAALAQSHGTFAGAVSLGFCPEQDYGGAELCAGSDGGLRSRPGRKGAIVLEPAARLADPWVAFQGQLDRVCSAATVDAFAARVGSAEVVRLASVGHGFGVERNWLPQFDAVYARLSQPAVRVAAAGGAAGAAAGAAVADLSLVEQRGTPRDTAPLALLLTGDGGWAALDRGVAAALNARGVPVIGLSTLQYFWRVKTPEQAAADTARILRHYLAAWHRERVLLVGYSFGADVLPFIVARLPDDLRARVQIVAMLGLSRQASFEIRVADWLRGPDAAARPTLPEIARLHDVRLLCVYGTGEANDPCAELGAGGVDVAHIGDGHHLGGDYNAIAAAIMESAERAEPAGKP